jgi:hypothetical protein
MSVTRAKNRNPYSVVSAGGKVAGKRRFESLVE